jgi:Tfp pilus assembly protein PilN
VRAVNLLPKDDAQRSKKQQNIPALVSSALIVLFTGLIGVLYFSAKSEAQAKDMELQDVKAELALLPTPSDIAAASAGTERLRAEHAARLAALSTALTHRVSWDRVLREISLVLPEDVWLRDMAAVSPATPGGAVPANVVGAPPEGFTINGYTYSHDAVARLLSRLAVIPDLQNVWLERSARADLGGRPIVTFTIRAGVRKSGGSS